MTRGIVGVRPDFAEREAKTQDLLQRWAAARCDTVRERLFEEIVLLNLDLCESLARRYANRGVDLDDLLQVARAGLVCAVRRYRPELPNFTAYAVPTITGELKRHFRDHGWVVRPPRRLQELRARAVATRREAEQQLQGSVSTAELSGLLGVAAPDVAECEHLGFRPLSLESSPDGADAFPLAERLASEDRDLELLPDLLSLREAVARLGERDLAILRWRFVDECTQAEIGRRLGVSQMQVSRLIGRLLAELRARLDPPAAAA